MVFWLRIRGNDGRVCSVIERQGLWSGGIVQTGYRLLPACCFVVVGIVVGVIVSAINVCSVGRGFRLVIGLLLVLSLLLGSCNVAASAFCGSTRRAKIEQTRF
jgi:hypothetical protein